MTDRTVKRLSIALFCVGLAWGLFTFLAYMGVPTHQYVYMQATEVQAVDESCGNTATTTNFICRGLVSLPSYVSIFLKMASPFYSYVVVCILFYAAFLLYHGYKSGRFEWSGRMRPLAILGIFLASVWLLGITLSLGTLYNNRTPDNAYITDVDGQRILPAFNRFYEPTPQVYSGVGEEGLAELQANYQSLLSRGCLTEVAETQTGAKVYDLSFFCMQSSFFTRVGMQVLLVLLFLINLLVLGRFIAKTVMRAAMPPLLELVSSFGLGALGWVAILWFLSLISSLNATLVWGLLVGIPVILFRQTLQWFREFVRPSIEVHFTWKSITVLCVWLLLSYLALNFLNVVRPFPIGWDDLGSYLNRPKLLASYGSFIPSMSQFQWEFLTSIGFVLFGPDNPIGATYAMQINWAAGLLALLVTYAAGRMYFGRSGGLLAAILYYTLPMTGHYSFADMKIDNASYFASAAAILCLLWALFPRGDEEGDDNSLRANWKLLIIGGLLLGFSFAIKPTAILAVLMGLSILVGAYLGALGFTGATFIGFIILNIFGPLDVQASVARAGLTAPASIDTIFNVLCLVLGAGFLGYALYRRMSTAKPMLMSFAMWALGIAVAMVPWMGYNAFVDDTAITPAKLLKANDTASVSFFYEQPAEPIPNMRVLPAELALDPNHPACVGSARTEELDRYWGFDSNLSHYATLPWRAVMNIDSFGYYVTLVPILLLVPVLMLAPAFWERRNRWQRLLFAGSLVFMVQWMFLANGIVWYGVGMFFGLMIAVEALVWWSPEKRSRFTFGGLIALSISIALINRLWQFDSQKNLFEYPLGKVTASALREMTIPHYDDIQDSVVSRHEAMPDTPYTYRIGTFIPYFIPKNREIMPVGDHQLTMFNCLNQEENHELTLKRLKAFGFNSIIFDTNTQTIERDPNGTLHKKVQKFVEFINDPVVGAQVQVNDPGNGIAYMLLP